MVWVLNSLTTTFQLRDSNGPQVDYVCGWCKKSIRSRQRPMLTTKVKLQLRLDTINYCATDHLIVMHAEHSFLPGDICMTWHENNGIVVYKIWLPQSSHYFTCLAFCGMRIPFKLSRLCTDSCTITKVWQIATLCLDISILYVHKPYFLSHAK